MTSPKQNDEWLDKLLEQVLPGDTRSMRQKRNIASFAVRRHEDEAVRLARIDQSKLTSRWIEDRIIIMQRSNDFEEEPGNVALTYAADQARQGAYKAIAELQLNKESQDE